MSTYPDAPAFPECKVYAYRCTDEKHKGEWTPPIEVGHGGMTKREYFAGMAMQGIFASYANVAVDTQHLNAMGHVRQSVEMADALIAELNK